MQPALKKWISCRRMFMTTPSDGFMMIIAQMVKNVYVFPQFFVKMFEKASIPSIIPWPPRKKSPVKDDRSEKMCYH